MFWKKKEKLIESTIVSIVDIDAARSYSIDQVAEICARYIMKYTKTEPDFSLNFGRIGFKGVEKLKQTLRNNVETEIVEVSGFSGKNYFSIINVELNYEDPKPLGPVYIVLHLQEETFQQDEFISFLKELYDIHPFDYGFMSGNHERDDDSWADEGVLKIREGEVKSIYPLNILNSSHRKNDTINNLINNFGNIEEIRNGVFVWYLDDKELQEIVK